MAALDPPGVPVLVDRHAMTKLRNSGIIHHGTNEVDTPIAKMPAGDISSINNKILRKAQKKYRKLIYRSMYPYGYNFIWNQPPGSSYVNELAPDAKGEGAKPYSGVDSDLKIHPKIYPKIDRKLKDRLWRIAYRKALRGKLEEANGNKAKIGRGEMPLRPKTAESLPKELYIQVGEGFAPHSETLREDIVRAHGGAILGTIAGLVAPLAIKGISALAKWIVGKIKGKKGKKKEKKEEKKKIKQELERQKEERRKQEAKSLDDASKKIGQIVTKGIESITGTPTATTTPTEVHEPTAPPLPEIPGSSNGIEAKGGKNDPDYARKVAEAAQRRGLVGYPNPFAGSSNPPTDTYSFFRDTFNKARRIMQEAADRRGIKQKYSVPFINRFIRKAAKQKLGTGGARVVLDTTKMAKPFTKFNLKQFIRPLIRANLGSRKMPEAMKKGMKALPWNIPIRGNGIADFLSNIAGALLGVPTSASDIDRYKGALSGIAEYISGKLSLPKSVGKIVDFAKSIGKTLKGIFVKEKPTVSPEEAKKAEKEMIEKEEKKIEKELSKKKPDVDKAIKMMKEQEERKIAKEKETWSRPEPGPTEEEIEDIGAEDEPLEGEGGGYAKDFVKRLSYRKGRLYAKGGNIIWDTLSHLGPMALQYGIPVASSVIKHILGPDRSSLGAAIEKLGHKFGEQETEKEFIERTLQASHMTPEQIRAIRQESDLAKQMSAMLRGTKYDTGAITTPYEYQTGLESIYGSRSRASPIGDYPIHLRRPLASRYAPKTYEDPWAETPKPEPEDETLTTLKLKKKIAAERQLLKELEEPEEEQEEEEKVEKKKLTGLVKKKHFKEIAKRLGAEDEPEPIPKKPMEEEMRIKIKPPKLKADGYYTRGRGPIEDYIYEASGEGGRFLAPGSAVKIYNRRYLGPTTADMGPRRKTARSIMELSKKT